MSFPDEFDFDSEIVGYFLLAELDTKDSFVRLILNAEGKFVDTNSVEWLGSKLISFGDMDFPTGGDAPAFELVLSYTVDPDVSDLISEVTKYGVDAIQDRDCNIYLQYLTSHEDMYKPIHAPVLMTTRKMMNLTYSFEGPSTRRITLTVEGPFSLRSKPVNGRYTDEDQRRRSGTGDPSLEFMPTNNFDEVTLFGL